MPMARSGCELLDVASINLSSFGIIEIFTLMPVCSVKSSSTICCIKLTYCLLRFTQIVNSSSAMVGLYCVEKKLAKKRLISYQIFSKKPGFDLGSVTSLPCTYNLSIVIGASVIRGNINPNRCSTDAVVPVNLFMFLGTSFGFSAKSYNH